MLINWKSEHALVASYCQIGVSTERFDSFEHRTLHLIVCSWPTAVDFTRQQIAVPVGTHRIQRSALELDEQGIAIAPTGPAGD